MNIQPIKINFKNKEYKITFKKLCNDDLKLKNIIKENSQEIKNNI